MNRLFAGIIKVEDKEEYLKSLLSELDRKKEQNAKGLFRIGERINHNTADYVRNYFKENQDYRVDIHSCSGCKSAIWDIVILFRK